MCSRTTCQSCGKPTYAGCGRHVEQVLGDVPPEKRCKCREQQSQQGSQPKAEGASFLSKLFGG